MYELSSKDYDDFEKQYKHIWVVKKEKNTSPAELRKKRLKASGWDVIKCRRYGNTEPELTPMAELLRNVMVTGTVPLSQRTSREKLIQFFVKLNLYNLRTSVEKL